ncbi:MAG: site-specific integrase [Candidatus Gastranaerophilales bacterium]|nr:site-specific integrase [Candidatus Gastranaerophilales bacterium]
MAVDNNYLLKNPWQNIKKFPVKNYSVRYLKPDEEERLFKVLPEYLKGIVIVALNTGLRKSNILELRWEQINFDFNFIEVLENKGNKHLLIPLNEKLIQFFSNKPDVERKGYIFINPETGLPYKDIKKAWSTALEKANIENFRFHDLRHTFATRLIEKNIDIVVAKELMGHADISTTMIYVHSDADRKKNAINVIDDY